MTMQDPVADMLTRIRNAQAVQNPDVSMPSSKLKVAIAQVLRSEGYVSEVSVSEGAKAVLTIGLKYHKGRPVIEVLDRISRPGLRIYRDKDELPSIQGGLGGGSSDAATATVTSIGVVTAVAPGVTTIIATSEGATASADMGGAASTVATGVIGWNGLSSLSWIPGSLRGGSG